MTSDKLLLNGSGGPLWLTICDPFFNTSDGSIQTGVDPKGDPRRIHFDKIMEDFLVNEGPNLSLEEIAKEWGCSLSYVGYKYAEYVERGWVPKKAGGPNAVAIRKRLKEKREP